MLEYRFAQITTAVAFLAILVGATVHPTGSSLACDDWAFVPTCNGELFPALTGGVLYEYGHRVVTWGAGMLTVGLAALLWWRRRRERTLLRLGIGAALAVALQGALGGITVLLDLSKPISILHLALAMAYFSLLVYLTFRLRVRSDAAAPELPASLRRWALIAVAAVYAQIVLGAVVRHTGAALQCIDIPLCGGRLWPEGTLAQIHMLHRFGAVVAGLLVLGSAGVVAWRGRGRVRLLAAGVLVTLAAQIALGIYSVLTFIAVPVVVAHLAVGALLLGLCLRLALALGRVPEARSVDVVPAWRDAPVGS